MTNKENYLNAVISAPQPKKKKKPKPQPEASAEPAAPEAVAPGERKDEMNGFHANGSVADGESLDSLSEQLDSASLDAGELDSEPAPSESTGNNLSEGREGGRRFVLKRSRPGLRITPAIRYHRYAGVEL